MPLITGKSPKSFSENVRTEMEHGKSQPQSLAIAYAMKRKAEQMAHGGMMKHKMADGGHVHTDECYAKGGCAYMAEGGYIEEEMASGYEPKPMEHESHEYDHPVENQSWDESEDMVDRIMRHREPHSQEYAHGGHVRYSEGGRVANDDEIEADHEMNQFDDLVKDDDLDEHYTGANSGDDIGNEHLDEEDEDLVGRIMRQRRMRDRNPIPA